MKTIIKIKGGYKWQREMALAVCSYCLKEFKIGKMPQLQVYIMTIDDCHGWCIPQLDGSQRIVVDKNQAMRDFGATIVHEMVHAKQNFTGDWSGSGELEAKRLQYKVIDEIWKKGFI
tara:strand:+ start:310 stop:660 length:351 start_codon:yes stop_codon:yes gene_type:complete